jgi:progesterone-induced-blocking factor 1
MSKLDDDFSKSELFDLSGELSNESSQLDGGSLDNSNFELDDEIKAFKLKSINNKKNQIEIKQLQHDLQVARIELSQREYQYNNIKMEHLTKTESLQEKVHELTHQNQLLNARLNSIEAIHQEEDERKQEQIKLELSRILVRQKELEENNERFMKNERDIKKELRNIDNFNWTNEEYEFMLRRDEDLLSIREFATLKLHSLTRPLKIKLEEALNKADNLEQQLKADRSELTKVKQVTTFLKNYFRKYFNKIKFYFSN